jgi:radical SAM superfamily enzyme YgiQ (UPF0313 family)
MTGLHKEVLKRAEEIKKSFPGIRTLLGGIHPTLFPDVIENPSVDLICRGEGEMPVVELLDAIDDGGGALNIPNISYKSNGKAIHNEMRTLTDPLDGLPMPDYSIYRDNPVIASDTYPMVFMTRGCPFSCTYCHNSNQKAIFKGKGRYVRSFGIERILTEVESALKSYPEAKAVLLGADTLGKDIKWLGDLLKRFNERFELPYNCLIRPEFIDEDLVRLLRDTNCHMVALGVESGSERVRKDLLNRRYTNERLMKAAGLLKSHGVKFRTYNIIGFPSETREEMLSTLELNIKIRPDYPWCSIFTPYPETKLAAYSIENGYLGGDFSYDSVPTSFFNDTVLKNVDRNFILNLHSFFQLTTMFPSLYPLVKVLIRLPHNVLYRLLFKVVYSITSLRSEKRTLASFLRIAFANRRLFK